MSAAAENAGRTRRVRINTLLYALSQAGAGIAGFVTSVALANHLGVSGYGAYAFVFSATTLFTFAADLGLSFYAFREISRSRQWLGHNYLPMMLLKTAAGGGLVLLSLPAVKILPLPDGTAPLLPLGFAVLALNSLNGAAYGVFRAYERAGFQAATVLMNRLTVLVLVVLFLVPMHRGAHEVLVVMLICGAFVCAANQLLVHRLCPAAFSGFGNVKGLLRGASPFMLIMLFNQLYLHADMGMLAFMRGTAESGLYAIPARLVTFGIIIPAAFVNALFPSLNRLRDSVELGPAVTGSLRALLLFALPVTACGMVLAGSFMAFFYDAAYAPAALSVRIMACTLGLMSVNWLLGHVLYAQGADRTMLKIVAGAVGLNVLLNTLAIPRFGSAGAAAATLVTECFIILIELRLVLKTVRIAWRRIPLGRIAAFTASAAVPMALLNRYVPFPLAAAGGCLCAAAAGWGMGLLRPAVLAGEAAA